MKTADIAKMLDGRQYTEEMTPEIEEALNETDIVVVFGASDDLMEFRGAIHDELDACGGATAYLNGQGLIKNKCEDEDCPYFAKEKEKATTIEAVWCDEGDGEFAWTYKTTIPHETFCIYDEEGSYCRGIVFRLADVDKAPEA